MKLDIQIGQRFNRLTVIKEIDRKRIPSGQTNRVFLCRCDCGKEKEIRLVHLYRNRTVSCGCIRKTGIIDNSLHKVWTAMQRRCNESYFENHLYFKKNITVCPEWIDSYQSFNNWSIENGYKKGLQIDRIDNSKGYYPGNCRWTTVIENVNNRDVTYFVEYYGKKIAFSLLLREKKLLNHSSSIRCRIKRGWTVEDAFDKPLRAGKYHRKFTL